MLLATLCPWPEVQPLEPWTDGLFRIELAKPNGAMTSASAADDWQAVRKWHRATIGPHGERTTEVEYDGCLSGSWRLRGDRPLWVVVTVTQTAKRIEYSLSVGGTTACRLQRIEFPRLQIGPGIGLGLLPGAQYLRSNKPSGVVVVWPGAQSDMGAGYTTGRVAIARAARRMPCP
jgi:hypothetical protein